MQRVSKLLLALSVCAAMALAAPPAFAQETLRLEGIVQNPDGAAVPGAKLWVRQGSNVYTAATSEQGGFNFEGLIAGNTEIVAYKEGFAIDGATVYMAGPTITRITLGQPGTKTLRILDEHAVPVPGAHVRSFGVDGRFHVSADLLIEHGFPLMRSGDEGTIQIDTLPQEKIVQVTIAHDAYADADNAFFKVDGETKNIPLMEGASVYVRVLAADGEPVANAEVLLVAPSPSGRRKRGGGFTDGEGLLTIRAPAGEYLLAVRHPEHGPPEPQPILIANAIDTRSQTIAMPRQRIITGAVVLEEDEPAPGVRVYARSGNTIHDDVLTGPDGRYRLQVGAAESLVGTVPPAGYMREIPLDLPVEFGDTYTTKLMDINLLPLPVITGTVVDNDRNPVPGALIATRDIPAARWAITGENGTFEMRLGYMPDQGKAMLRAEHPFRFLRRDFDVKLTDPEAGRIRLRTFEPEQGPRTEVPAQNNIAPLLDKPAPPIVCSQWFNSEPLAIEDLRNKVVVLTFWSGFVDSPDGINRVNELRALHALLEGVDDVVFIIVHDAISTSAEVQNYIGVYQIPFAVGLDKEPVESYNAYGINIAPQTVLIGKKGLLRYHQVEGRLLELIKVLRREG